jgi:hypothetical protein
MKTQRKKKEARPKKKERGGLWKLPQPWKSEKVAFGDFFLMISTAWKSRRKKRSGFSTVTTGPTAVNNQPRSLSFSVSHGWGAVHPILNSHRMKIEN